MGRTAPDDILKILRQHPGGFISGGELSQALGVSRTAVWKQMELLRERGYIIEAVTSRGYRLLESPDLLLPAEIAGGPDQGVIGREVLYLETTDSTNVRAQELGEAGAVEGTVVIADRQTAGKGRLGRQWVSPPGVNFYASVLLRPPIPPTAASQLTFLSAVAVARAIEESSGLQPRVKWPNDILLAGRKVAGLLNELSAETERIHYVILGIGVNLNMRSDQFPSDLRYPATSVALEKGMPVSRTAFARALFRHLDELYRVYLAEGFGTVLRAWESFFDLQGREVEVDMQPTRRRGTIVGLDAEGALLLRVEGGGTERVLAGDVRPL